MPEYSPFTYLTQLLLTAYLYIVLLRLVMQCVGVNFFNPLVQMTLKLTDWAVKPLRKVTPGYKGIDFAIVLFWWIVAVLNYTVFTWIDLDSGFPNVFGLLIWVFGDFLYKLLDIYLVCIIARAIMSWFPNMAHNPAGEAIYLITEPIRRRVSQLLPATGAIDFSPLIILLLIYVLQNFLVLRIILMGKIMAVS